MNKVNSIKKLYMTVQQAADKIGVSSSRMHVLIKTYDLETETFFGTKKFLLKSELKKVPKKRPTGVHISNKSA